MRRPRNFRGTDRVAAEVPRLPLQKKEPRAVLRTREVCLVLTLRLLSRAAGGCRGTGVAAVGGRRKWKAVASGFPSDRSCTFVHAVI